MLLISFFTLMPIIALIIFAAVVVGVVHILSSCHQTASDANLLDDLHTFHGMDYFVIGGIRTCFIEFPTIQCPYEFL